MGYSDRIKAFVEETRGSALTFEEYMGFLQEEMRLLEEALDLCDEEMSKIIKDHDRFIRE